MLSLMNAKKLSLLILTLLCIESLFVGCEQLTLAISPTVTRQATQVITSMPAGTSTAPTLVPEFSTPQLIDQAYANGEITAEYRLLYLAYAILEYESLPSRFRGNVGWRGTSIIWELRKAANDPATLCSMSPNVRSEFQRLLRSEIICE